MPAAPNVAQPALVHRGLRLLPESRARAHQLAGTAGAGRRIWPHWGAGRTPQRGPAPDPHPSRRALVDQAPTLVAEALHTQGMTQTARGPEAPPGPTVTAKAGLTRSI